MPDEIPVDLDRHQSLAPLQQPLSECAAPGADFDDAGSRFRLERLDDAVECAGIRQEVLAESFPRRAEPARRPFL
jgi:hypothetical protein